jgi:hypothetical protein
MRSRRPILLISLAIFVASTLTTRAALAGNKDPVELIQAQTEIPEDQLLDVGIQVFDPGLPQDGEALAKLEAEGVFPDLRKSEARYIPFQLMQTLQSTGFWGAVRLVPAANVVDVMVTGTILKSNGKKLELEVVMLDARGKRWLKERYKQEATFVAYESAKSVVEKPDPYQYLYNRLSNDMLERRRKLDREDIEEVRMVSQLKFAVDLAPTPFADYLKVNDKKGRYSIKKLPARDDPMMARVAEIRERDFMFIDTLNEFYANFQAKMDEPYDNWRAFSYEEQVELDRLRREAMWRTIFGAAAVVGGAMTKGRGRGVLIAGGTAVLLDSLEKSEEMKMHVESLRELGASFDADVAPLLVDVEGEVMRLTGSVETQYATWRALLRRIFAAETGLPLDPNSETALAKPGSSNH